MRSPDVTAVLFDVFGTLVHYQPDAGQLAFPETHGLLVEWGGAMSHDEFVAAWTRSSAALEAHATRTLEEHSMHDSARAFAAAAAAARVLPALDDERCAVLGQRFLAEWRRGIRHIDGVAAMVRRLAGRYRLGVVSNTHDAAMVPELLDALGVGDAFEVVVLSVEHGHRKPHPSIYAAALDALGCAPARTAFVGDTFEADFAGPARAGLHPFLIDPGGHHPVPAAQRLASILDLEPALARA